MGAYFDGEIARAIAIAHGALDALNKELRAATEERGKNIHDLYVGPLVISSGETGLPVAVLWEEDAGMTMGELYGSDETSEKVREYLSAIVSPNHYGPVPKTN